MTDPKHITAAELRGTCRPDCDCTFARGAATIDAQAEQIATLTLQVAEHDRHAESMTKLFDVAQEQLKLAVSLRDQATSDLASAEARCELLEDVLDAIETAVTNTGGDGRIRRKHTYALGDLLSKLRPGEARAALADETSADRSEEMGHG